MRSEPNISVVASRRLRISLVICFKVAIATLLLWNTGCAKQMPADWPIPTLTLPAQSELVRVLVVSNSTFHEREWVLEFRSQLSGNEVRDHVESCLKPLGYRRSAIAGWEDTICEAYFLPDGSLEISLVNNKDWHLLPKDHKGSFDFRYNVCMNEPLEEGVVLPGYEEGEPL